jgi:VanZ family protein
VRWLAVVALAGFIFYASILTAPPGTPVDDVKPDLLPLDKWRHFVAYATLGGALAYATTDWNVDGRLLAVGVIGITVLYGVGVEFGQSTIPNRYFSLADAYANALGGVLVVPWYLVRPRLEFVPIERWYRALVGED